MGDPPPDLETLLSQASWIRRLAQRLVRAGDDVDDVVQETLLRAWQHPPQEGRAPRPWLRAVLNNVHRRLHRDRTTRARHERDASADGGAPGAAEIVARGELQRRVVEAVMGLEEPYRTVLLLRYFEGETSTRIARRLGVAAGTVRWRLSIALGQLRERLKGCSLALLCLPLESVARPRWVVGRRVAAVALVGALATAPRWWPGGDPGGAGSAGDALLAEAPDAPASAPPPGREEASDAGANRASPLVAPAPSRALVAAGATPTPTSHPLVLLDEAGRPLPGFALIVECGEESTQVCSDADGVALVSSAAVQVRPTDHALLAPQWSDVVEVQALPCDERGRRELRLRPGPTFFLEFERPPSAAHEVLEVAMIPANFFDGLDAPRHATAPLREDDRGVWVRFGPLLEEGIQAAGSPLQLAVRDFDGRWYGAVELVTPREHEHEPLAIPVQPCGRLDVQLVNAAGAEVSDAEVWVSRLDAPAELQRHESAVGGLASFRWLPVGPYRLRAFSNRHQLVVADVDVGHEGRRIELVLDERPDAGRVQGRVTSRSGRFGEEARVRMWGRDSKARTDLVFWAPIEWHEQAGQRVGRYRFLAVPPGEYEIEVRSFFHHDFEPESARVRPGAEVHFVCQDDRPHADLGFAVADAETGDPVDRFGLRYVLYNDRGFEFGQREARTPWIRALPLHRSVDCFVHVPGYAVWHGELGDFAPVQGRPGYREARVLLERGWGALFRLEGPAGEALEGAELLLDERSAGRTDARGRCFVHWPERPRRVAVPYRGWILQAAAGPGESVPFEDQKNVVRLFLRPGDRAR